MAPTANMTDVPKAIAIPTVAASSVNTKSAYIIGVRLAINTFTRACE